MKFNFATQHLAILVDHAGRVYQHQLQIWLSVKWPHLYFLNYEISFDPEIPGSMLGKVTFLALFSSLFFLLGFQTSIQESDSRASRAITLEAINFFFKGPPR